MMVRDSNTFIACEKVLKDKLPTVNEESLYNTT